MNGGFTLCRHLKLYIQDKKIPSSYRPRPIYSVWWCPFRMIPLYQWIARPIICRPTGPSLDCLLHVLKDNAGLYGLRPLVKSPIIKRHGIKVLRIVQR